MTINTNLSRVQYTGNGVTTAFAFANRVTDATLLSVIRTVIATGVNTTLILNDPGVNGFSVAGVPGNSVTINTITAPANLTEALTIAYNIPYTQTADYVANDPFPAETHEGALDKLTLLVQQLVDGVNRSLKFTTTSSTALNGTLPSVPVDGAALVWSGTTGAVASGPTASAISGAAVNAATATAAAASAAASAAAINFRYCGVATGTANALVLTPGAALSSYSGAFLEFIVGFANTSGTVNANVSGLGNVALKVSRRGVKTDFGIGALQPGTHVAAQYDGVDLVALNLLPLAPTVTDLTSGSGTYNTKAGCTALRIRMVGSGEGGTGSGTSAGTGSVGTATTFGTATTNTPGNPGTNVDMSIIGGGGQNGNGGVPTSYGGYGGGTPFGSSTPGPNPGPVAGNPAGANTGGGGSGASCGATVGSGRGGNGGTYCEKWISNPAASYSYTVAASAAGGTAGTSGSAGGASGSGRIYIEEFYS